MWPLVGSRNWLPKDQEWWCNEAKTRRLCVTTLFRPKSPSIRLKFGNRTATAIVYVISLIWSHATLSSACWALPSLSPPILFDFIPPVSFITTSHSLSHCSHLQHLWTPRVSACFWCMLSHSITHPPTGGVRDLPQHTQLTVLLQSLLSFGCAFRSLIQLRVRVCSPVVLDNRSKRGRAPPRGHNKTLALIERIITLY